MKKICTKFKDMLVEFTSWILFASIIIGSIGAITHCIDNHKNTDVIIQVDSLQKVNDTIEHNIHKLDSIKNVEIIKVTTLSNDSTLELFYNLLRR